MMSIWRDSEAESTSKKKRSHKETSTYFYLKDFN